MNIVTGKQRVRIRPDPEHEQGGEAQLQTLRHPPVRQPGSEVHFAFSTAWTRWTNTTKRKSSSAARSEGTAAEHEGAHLYKQILVSIRLLDAQRTVPIQLREQIDFARILYDKGLFRQSTKILEKAKEQALFYEQYTQAIEIIEFQKRLGTLSVSRGLVAKSETVSRQVAELCTRIKTSTNCRTAGRSSTGSTCNWDTPVRRKTST